MQLCAVDLSSLDLKHYFLTDDVEHTGIDCAHNCIVLIVKGNYKLRMCCLHACWKLYIWHQHYVEKTSYGCLETQTIWLKINHF